MRRSARGQHRGGIHSHDGSISGVDSFTTATACCGDKLLGIRVEYFVQTSQIKGLYTHVNSIAPLRTFGRSPIPTG